MKIKSNTKQLPLEFASMEDTFVKIIQIAVRQCKEMGRSKTKLSNRWQLLSSTTSGYALIRICMIIGYERSQDMHDHRLQFLSKIPRNNSLFSFARMVLILQQRQWAMCLYSRGSHSWTLHNMSCLQSNSSRPQDATHSSPTKLTLHYAQCTRTSNISTILAQQDVKDSMLPSSAKHVAFFSQVWNPTASSSEHGDEAPSKKYLGNHNKVKDHVVVFSGGSVGVYQHARSSFSSSKHNLLFVVIEVAAQQRPSHK